MTITGLIRQLGGKGALERNSEVIEQLNDDQLAIVIKAMRDSKALAKAAEQRSVEPPE